MTGFGGRPAASLVLLLACASDRDKSEPPPARVPLTFASPLTCGWVYAVGRVGEFEVWQVSLDLDDGAYVADEPFELERGLEVGEFTWSEVASEGPVTDLDVCSDSFEGPILESRAVSGGRVSLRLEPAGSGDTGCSRQEHLYTGTLRIEGVEVEGRPLDPVELTGGFGRTPC